MNQHARNILLAVLILFPVSEMWDHAAATETAQIPAPRTSGIPLETLGKQDSILPPQGNPGEWLSLFNGKDLAGWTPKIKGYPLGENFGNTFRVEDGVLKVRYDQYGGKFNSRFGHLFFEHPYSEYRLRVEYRFVEEQLPDGPGWAWRNSGVMLHGQDPKTMDVDQDFPVSIEVQLLGGDGKEERTTANLCTPGTNVVMHDELIRQHCTNSTSKTYHGDQWVTVEIEVQGGKLIRHLIDGVSVLEYEEPQLDPGDKDGKKLVKGDNLLITGGYISLQSESHPVEFRKVEIMQPGL